MPNTEPNRDSLGRFAGAETLLERFEEKYIPEPNTGCWLWEATGNGRYGQLTVSGKSQGAHRVSWSLFVGPIPSGMLVLHKCDTPACVNPDHLWLGTYQDNVDDMLDKGRGAALRGECRRGHPMDETNAYLRPDGDRECRTCSRRMKRARRAARRAADD